MAKRKTKRRTGQAKPKPRQATKLKLARVVTAMRSEDISLSRAAREESVSPATVLRHAKGALRKNSRGTYKARASDASYGSWCFQRWRGWRKSPPWIRARPRSSATTGTRSTVI